MSTAPNMYVSPKLSSESQTQLKSARRFLKTMVAIGGPACDASSNPSHSTNRSGAEATDAWIRRRAHRSSRVEAAGITSLVKVRSVLAALALTEPPSRNERVQVGYEPRSQE